VDLRRAAAAAHGGSAGAGARIRIPGERRRPELEIYRGERMLSTAVVLEHWQPAQTLDGDEIWFRVQRVP